VDDTSDILITFEAHEGALVLVFSPESAVPAGARCGLVQVTLGRLEAEVQTLVDADPRRMRDELRSILSSPTISGTAGFGSIENDLHVHIELHQGKGALVARVETDFGDHEGAAEFRLTTDQAALRQTVRQLDALLRAFPTL
jgi:hypothetical protein